MNKIRVIVFLLLIYALISQDVYSQVECGTVAPDASWEKGFAQKIAEYKLVMTQNNLGLEKIRIPVILHILHNDRQDFTEENISDKQALSQFNILNADFSGTNIEIPNTPDQFKPVLAGDIGIEFVPAKYGPSGNLLAVAGIERINMKGKGWERIFANTDTDKFKSDFNSIVKPATIWDPSKYLNIWIAPFKQKTSLLGYATFPKGIGFVGVYGEEVETSGVVIDYTAWGNLGKVEPPYNLGRTATHEIGHWLGVRHIWGDTKCGDDGIDDTPQHNDKHRECPPSVGAYNILCKPFSPSLMMTMNHMDYTNDECRYMFTAGQRIRMLTALHYGTYRKTLATSPAIDPTPNYKAGLIAYYTFDGNGNDLSGNGNNATAVNGPTYVADRNGKPASAAQFDGADDYFTVPNSPSLQSVGNLGSNSDFTFCSWVKSAGDFFVLCKANGNNLQYRFFGKVNNGLNADHFNTALGVSESMPSNEWNFVALVKSGNSYTFYRNGNLIGPVQVGTNGYTADPTTHLEIGRDVPGNTEYTSGALDEIRIYNRALSQEELHALFMDEAPPVDLKQGLIAHYPFNDNATDITGNGHNGTVYGATATYGVNGDSKTAYLLDGKNSYIDLGPGFDFAGKSFTISLFAKTISNPGNNPTLVLQGTPEQDKGLALMLGQNFMRFDFYGSSMDSYRNFPALNKWGYWTCTYNAATQERKLYLDGLLIASDKWTPYLGSGNLMIGRNYFDVANNRFYHGVIDQLRVYDRALTSAEVAELYVQERPNTHPDVSTDLIAYYPLDNSAEDRSTYTNHGTPQGVKFVADRSNQPRSAAYFNGVDNYISVPTSPSLEAPEQAITIMAWVKPEGTNNGHSIVCKTDINTYDPYQYRFGYNYVGPFLGFKNSQGGWNGNDQNPNSILEEGKWYHLAGTYDGANMRFYVDGKLISTISQTGQIFSDGKGLEIGRDLHGGIEYYKGWIDEVRIYKRALSESEIAQFALTPVIVTNKFVIETGNNIATGFDYPISDGGVKYPEGIRYELPEQITNAERNLMYPENPSLNGLRGSGSKEGWHNLQDVGAYYQDKGGIHPGEDWNKSKREYNSKDGTYYWASIDKGLPVYAIANGKVVKVRDVWRGKPGKLGYLIVIEHELPNQTKVWSTYTHVVAANYKANDGTVIENTDGLIVIPELPVNSYVAKGQVIARIAQPTDVGSHLHFEIRDVKPDFDNFWPENNGLGYYSISKTDISKKEKVLEVFKKMRNYGYLDASDFIDDNRTLQQPTNFNQLILCGDPNKPAKDIPVTFSFSNTELQASDIREIEVYNGETGALAGECSYVTGSLKQIGNGNWQFRFNFSSAKAWKVLDRYTLRFKVAHNKGEDFKRADLLLVFNDGTKITDISKATNNESILYGFKNGLFNGLPNNTFKPDEDVTPAQMAKFLVSARMMAGNYQYDVRTDKTRPADYFLDFKPGNNSFLYVQHLRNTGGIHEAWLSNPYYDPPASAGQPSRKVTIGEVAKAVCILFNITSDDIPSAKGISRIYLPKANGENKQYLELLLNVYVRIAGNLKPLAKPTLFVGANKIEDVTGEEHIKRSALADLISTLHSTRVNNLPLVQPLSADMLITQNNVVDSSLSNYSAIGVIWDLPRNGGGFAMSHPFTLDTIRISPYDSLEIGTPHAYDESGERLFFYWSSNKGRIHSVDNSLSQITFKPTGLKTGDTAIIYSYVGNRFGQFSEGTKLIVIDSVTQNFNDVSVSIDTSFLSFQVSDSAEVLIKRFSISNSIHSRGIFSASLKLSDSSAFSLTGYNYQVVLPPGKSDSIYVAYEPRSGSKQSGTVDFWHNISGIENPLRVGLFGSMHLPDSLVNVDKVVVDNYPCDSSSTNGAISLKVNDTAKVATISWKRNGQAIPDTGMTIANLRVGDYEYVLRDTSGREIRGTITLPSRNALNVAVTSSPAACKEGLGQLSLSVSGGSGKYGFIWSDSSSVTSMLNARSGQYSVLIQDSVTGCKTSVSSEIRVVASGFTIRPQSILPLCKDTLQLITLIDSGAIGKLQYSFSGGPFGDTSKSWLPIGNHTVYAKDSLGCMSMASFELSLNPELIVSVRATEAICGNPGKAIVTTVGGTGTYSFKWNDGNFGDSTEVPLAPGMHRVVVSDGLCQVADSFEVAYSVPAASFSLDSLDVEVGDNLVCRNTSYGATSFAWYLDSVLVSNDEQYAFVPSASKSYEVRLLAGINTCTDTFTQVIRAYPEGVLSSCLKYTVKSGNISDPSVWHTGIVPSSCDSIIIANGDTLYLDSIVNVRAVYVVSGGTIIILDSTARFIVGDSTMAVANLNVDGKFEIKNGSVHVNGRVSFGNGSSFLMSGGLLKLDGNSGARETSVPGNQDLFEASANMVQFEFSNGILQIIDPPFEASSEAINCTYNFGDSSILKLGDGFSTTSSDNPNGFGGNLLPSRIGKLILDSKSNTGNRHFINLSPISTKSPIQVISGELIQKARFEIRQ